MAATAQTPRLPQRLLNFFARYPPALYSAQYANPARPPLTRPPKRSAKDKSRASSTTSSQNTSSSDPNTNITDTPSTSVQTSIPPSETPSISPSTSNGGDRKSQITAAALAATTSLRQATKLIEAEEHPNPFLPWKNPITNRWRGAAISLRRQAGLVKLAKAHGVEPLLPPGRKSTEYKEQKLIEKGLRVKGTGVGQKVKGHKWERMKNVQLEERRKAMEGMPELVKLWKQRGHGKWWKKYPR